MNELYELTKFVDHPMYEGFGLDPDAYPSNFGHDSLLDDMVPGFGDSSRDPNWTPRSLLANWSAPVVEGRVAPFNDYPCINLTHPVFSSRAVDALRDLLEPNGELLPVGSPHGRYWFFFVTQIADVVDLERSDVIYATPPTKFSTIRHLAFRSDGLEGLSIFTLRQASNLLIASDVFVNRVQKCGLNGFEFRKMWPSPPGVNWRRRHGEAKKAAATVSDSPPQANTLVVMLPFEGKALTANQKKLLTRIENELDALLLTPGLDSPYFGRYEGRDTVENEVRLFLSCPDADVLEQNLIPWLAELPWAGGEKRLLKRYGPMHDESAREIYVGL